MSKANGEKGQSCTGGGGTRDDLVADMGSGFLAGFLTERGEQWRQDRNRRPGDVRRKGDSFVEGRGTDGCGEDGEERERRSGLAGVEIEPWISTIWALGCAGGGSSGDGRSVEEFEFEVGAIAVDASLARGYKYIGEVLSQGGAEIEQRSKTSSQVEQSSLPIINSISAGACVRSPLSTSVHTKFEFVEILTPHVLKIEPCPWASASAQVAARVGWAKRVT
ncbi:hypothetical protein FA13DRAFT_1713220 [Coprinellus micaceus]|uniref:Uncharacterized protein n=1 Tax=Coprinellus micaceus TaxID=71717 RepID=A0A4Y7SXS7_COPMI|nr:hypothetical protein FA13DRAFT_1713220 [Coprinellus micaceus]